MAEHAYSIEREYNRATGVWEWWFVCTCGAMGERRMVPREAERDGDAHAGTVAGVKE